MRQASLAVVGQDHDIGVRQALLEFVELRLQRFVARRILEVDAQQLLLTADHAKLHGRRERRIALQARRDAVRGEQALHAAAGLVVADDGQQRDLRADRGGIACDVRGATQTLFGPLDLHDRHRSFRRDAVHFAEPVAVEHDVTDHQYPRRAQARELGRDR